MRTAIIISLIFWLSIATCFADLSNKEKNFLQDIYERYGHRAEEDEDAAAKVEIIINGTEEERKALIVELLTDHFIPKWQRAEISYQEHLTKIQNKISQGQAYVSNNQ